MARKINKLTARFVATVDKIGRHSDGGGLYLSIICADDRKADPWDIVVAPNFVAPGAVCGDGFRRSPT